VDGTFSFAGAARRESDARKGIEACVGVEVTNRAGLTLAGRGRSRVRRDFARQRDRRFLQVMVARVHHGHREVKRSLDHRHLGKTGY